MTSTSAASAAGASVAADSSTIRNCSARVPYAEYVPSSAHGGSAAPTWLGVQTCGEEPSAMAGRTVCT